MKIKKLLIGELVEVDGIFFSIKKTEYENFRKTKSIRYSLSKLTNKELQKLYKNKLRGEE